MRLFRRRSEQRTIPDGGPVWPTNGWAPSAYSSTPERALAIGDVWSCVKVLADAAASVPLIPYRRTTTGRVRLSTGKLAGLLDRPAPATTQANLIAQMVSHLTLWGNAYLGKFRGEDGRVEQLGLLFPDYVSVELQAGLPLYTVDRPADGPPVAPRHRRHLPRSGTLDGRPRRPLTDQAVQDRARRCGRARRVHRSILRERRASLRDHHAAAGDAEGGARAPLDGGEGEARRRPQRAPDRRHHRRDELDADDRPPR